MLTELEGNNCFSIIFKGEHQELQNNGQKQGATDMLVSLLSPHLQSY